MSGRASRESSSLQDKLQKLNELRNVLTSHHINQPTPSPTPSGGNTQDRHALASARRNLLEEERRLHLQAKWEAKAERLKQQQQRANHAQNRYAFGSSIPREGSSSGLQWSYSQINISQDQRGGFNRFNSSENLSNSEIQGQRFFRRRTDLMPTAPLRRSEDRDVMSASMMSSRCSSGNNIHHRSMNGGLDGGINNSKGGTKMRSTKSVSSLVQGRDNNTTSPRFPSSMSSSMISNHSTITTVQRRNRNAGRTSRPQSVHVTGVTSSSSQEENTTTKPEKKPSQIKKEKSEQRISNKSSEIKAEGGNHHHTRKSDKKEKEVVVKKEEIKKEDIVVHNKEDSSSSVEPSLVNEEQSSSSVAPPNQNSGRKILTESEAKKAIAEKRRKAREEQELLKRKQQEEEEENRKKKEMEKLEELRKVNQEQEERLIDVEPQEQERETTEQQEEVQLIALDDDVPQKQVDSPQPLIVMDDDGETLKVTQQEQPNKIVEQQPISNPEEAEASQVANEEINTKTPEELENERRQEEQRKQEEEQEASRIRLELEIKLKKEEEERIERRKRVEAIMKRTRGAKNNDEKKIVNNDADDHQKNGEESRTLINFNGSSASSEEITTPPNNNNNYDTLIDNNNGNNSSGTTNNTPSPSPAVVI